MSALSNVTRPRRGTSPSRARKVVVLPTPFRPKRAVTPPSGTSNETPWRTCDSPRLTCRSRTSKRAVISAPAPAKPAPPLLGRLRRAYGAVSAPAPAKPAPPLLDRLRRAYGPVSAPAPAKPAPPLLDRLRRAYGDLCRCQRRRPAQLAHVDPVR